PCHFQYKLYCAQQSRKNIISIARTGSGKTLTYLMPLIAASDSIIIIVTALNILGEQFEREARAAGFSAKSVNGENDSDQVFNDIRQLKYRVVIFSPDTMMKRGGRCQTMLWPNKKFVSKVQRVVFDEAHCIVQWGGSFRPEYKEATNIGFYLPNVPIYLSSATMPPTVITQLKELFRLHDRDTLVFRRSNDRPNVALVVRRMQHPQNSYEDLAFLVPKNWKDGDSPPKKFMVFFNNKKEAESAAKFLQARVSVDLCRKIPWFHAGMTRFFRVEEVDNLRRVHGEEHEVWGFAATDSGGLGLDIPNIEIVVQWKVPNNLDTLIQRFGRAVRDYSLQGVAILISEPQWFYEDQKRLQKTREQRRAKRQRAEEDNTQLGPSKRPRTQPHTSATMQVLSPSSRANRISRQDPSGAPPMQADPSTALTDVSSREPVALDEDGDSTLECEESVDGNSDEEVVVTVTSGERQAIESEWCCERCAVRPASICCDICHADEVTALIPIRNDTPAVRPKKTRRLKIPAFTMSMHEKKLRDELYKWRDATAKTDMAEYEDFGGDILMHYRIVERIVELAHAQKLNTVQDIQEHANWCWAQQYG
ncbi:P-loop containing nucleoside triphosphate hydrolase protein, partial [Cytidiella melzeri]